SGSATGLLRAPARLQAASNVAATSAGSTERIGAMAATSRSGGGREAQRRGIHAVTQSGRLGAVVEHVAQVRIATCTCDLGADHAEAEVAALAHVFGGDWLPEAGPAGARFELGGRIVQRRVAAQAAEHALAVFLKQGASKGAFGAFVAGDLVRQRRQLAAPFGVRLHDPGQLRQA